jgi:hypothetical protein
MSRRKAEPSNSDSEKKFESHVPYSERSAWVTTWTLENYIREHRGQYLRDEDGSLHLIIGGRRIALDQNPNNHGLAGLMIQACEISTLSATARATIQRIQVKAYEGSSRICLRRFSALSQDRKRLYVAVDGGKPLQVTAETISHVDNGSNADAFWVEHPEDAPFKYSPSDPIEGLRLFDKLLVETQACLHPEMRWLVAMNEGLFPYIREGFPARFLTVHIGPSQQGKTTGAQRFTLLHGLGDVIGDFSVAALANRGDIGLLVLDNKEQANFSQELIDFCLYLATGAQRGRSSKDGIVRRSGSRPVGVITTIEGVYKDELRRRCVEVQYRLSGPELPRHEIENEIRQRRDQISSAMVCVLQQYLRNTQQHNSVPNVIPGFQEHFGALCDLLRGYGEVTKRPPEWAEEIIRAWYRILGEPEIEEDELEHPVLRVLQEGTDHHFLEQLKSETITFHGKRGRLHVTECGPLLTALQGLNIRGLVLPKNGSGLGRRLRGTKYRSFEVLDEQSAPELAMLKRTSEKRGPVGIFFADDGMTAAPHASIRAVIPQPSVN